MCTAHLVFRFVFVFLALLLGTGVKKITDGVPSLGVLNSTSLFVFRELRLNLGHLQKCARGRERERERERLRQKREREAEGNCE
jgi:hypothetical protein